MRNYPCNSAPFFVNQKNYIDLQNFIRYYPHISVVFTQFTYLPAILNAILASQDEIMGMISK